MAFRTPEEAAKSLGNTITAERLIELADAGYAPHDLIDGRGPWFKIAELRQWFDGNAVQADGGLPMPTWLSLIVPFESRPTNDAPASISRLIGLCHIDPAHLLCPGVYFLCQGDDVVYVGQSVCVSDRMMSHIRESRRRAGKTFDPLRIFTYPSRRTSCFGSSPSSLAGFVRDITASSSVRVKGWWSDARQVDPTREGLVSPLHGC